MAEETERPLRSSIPRVLGESNPEVWAGLGFGMSRELVRYQDAGHFHFVTFSCFGRRPYLRTAFGRNLFERSLETMRVRYRFWWLGMW